MKKILLFLFVLTSFVSFGQISKTGGLLYSNGNPNTRGIDTLVTKNLSKNSEVCIDYSTGTIYTFDRSDSSFVKYDSRPYKVYSALITQDGTNAPVATVLENTLGGVISFGYDGIGSYPVSCSPALLTSGKTTIIIGDSYNDVVVSTALFNVAGSSLSTSGFTIYSYEMDGTPDLSNNSFLKTLIEIRVYD